eukprot:gnl/TRDRNA2_/TRDRNA2_59857_c1_seq1.p1 gnl/TRDRNA2_/TRDRNA2_59857_c1~~gnl/TRDRNA2_/TRDRNA2_59857_c1_seq1.p1  ORF type:complete len:129 (+),score=7.32 gnl/TRDRNA2_/TRDRNA2_59857_c1_seq1:184-570(+)
MGRNTVGHQFACQGSHAAIGRRQVPGWTSESFGGPRQTTSAAEHGPGGGQHTVMALYLSAPHFNQHPGRDPLECAQVTHKTLVALHLRQVAMQGLQAGPGQQRSGVPRGYLEPPSIFGSWIVSENSVN